MRRSQFVFQPYTGRSRRLAIPLLGALASLLLHALLLAPVLFGGATRASTPPPSEYRSSSVESTGGSRMELVFIETPESDSIQTLQSAGAASLSQSLQTLLAPVSMPDARIPTPLTASDNPDEEGPAVSEAGTNDPGLAQLLGRYAGQIDARVRRAWIRPRAPVAEALFACRVRIDQEPNGRVREIELVSCNGDVTWQASLVRAIESASPLPAPPDPRVFSPVLTLEFTSQPYTPGDSPEGFEPEPRTVMK
jgi:TonB C terminal